MHITTGFFLISLIVHPRHRLQHNYFNTVTKSVVVLLKKKTNLLSHTSLLSLGCHSFLHLFLQNNGR